MDVKDIISVYSEFYSNFLWIYKCGWALYFSLFTR